MINPNERIKPSLYCAVELGVLFRGHPGRSIARLMP